MAITKFLRLFAVVLTFLILGSVLVSKTQAYEATCGVPQAYVGSSTQHWDYDLCITSRNAEDLKAIRTVRADCESNFDFIPGDWTEWALDQVGGSLECRKATKERTFEGPLEVRFNAETELYSSCIAPQGLDRNIRSFSIKILDTSGRLICDTGDVRVDKTNQTWLEILDRHLESVVVPFVGTPFDFLDAAEQAESGFQKITCINEGINTALGCIKVNDVGAGIGQILRLAIGIGGGLALLLMGYGAYILTTSAGIPDKVSQGKDIISSAAYGLMFMVLGVVLYQIIANILNLPGLQ